MKRHVTVVHAALMANAETPAEPVECQFCSCVFPSDRDVAEHYCYPVRSTLYNFMQPGAGNPPAQNVARAENRQRHPTGRDLEAPYGHVVGPARAPWVGIAPRSFPVRMPSGQWQWPAPTAALQQPVASFQPTLSAPPMHPLVTSSTPAPVARVLRQVTTGSVADRSSGSTVPTGWVVVGPDNQFAPQAVPAMVPTLATSGPCPATRDHDSVVRDQGFVGSSWMTRQRGAPAWDTSLSVPLAWMSVNSDSAVGSTETVAKVPDSAPKSSMSTDAVTGTVEAAPGNPEWEVLGEGRVKTPQPLPVQRSASIEDGAAGLQLAAHAFLDPAPGLSFANDVSMSPTHSTAARQAPAIYDGSCDTGGFGEPDTGFNIQTLELAKSVAEAVVGSESEWDGSTVILDDFDPLHAGPSGQRFLVRQDAFRVTPPGTDCPAPPNNTPNTETPTSPTESTELQHQLIQKLIPLENQNAPPTPSPSKANSEFKFPEFPRLCFFTRGRLSRSKKESFGIILRAIHYATTHSAPTAGSQLYEQIAPVASHLGLRDFAHVLASMVLAQQIEGPAVAEIVRLYLFDLAVREPEEAARAFACFEQQYTEFNPTIFNGVSEVETSRMLLKFAPQIQKELQIEVAELGCSKE